MQTALGPPYSKCRETEDYRQVNCINDCIFRAMSELCRCKYPEECGSYVDWSVECQGAYDYNRSAIQSNWNLQCPSECNQVSFALNRIDVESDIDNDNLDDYYKRRISGKFNITGMSDDQLIKRMTLLYIYFSKLLTTEISQSPSMTPTNMVGNVEGLLGKKSFIFFSFLPNQLNF